MSDNTVNNPQNKVQIILAIIVATSTIIVAFIGVIPLIVKPSLSALELTSTHEKLMVELEIIRREWRDLIKNTPIPDIPTQQPTATTLVTLDIPTNTPSPTVNLLATQEAQRVSMRTEAYETVIADLALEPKVPDSYIVANDFFVDFYTGPGLEYTKLDKPTIGELYRIKAKSMDNSNQTWYLVEVSGSEDLVWVADPLIQLLRGTQPIEIAATVPPRPKSIPPSILSATSNGVCSSSQGIGLTVTWEDQDADIAQLAIGWGYTAQGVDDIYTRAYAIDSISSSGMWVGETHLYCTGTSGTACNVRIQAYDRNGNSSEVYQTVNRCN